MVEWLTAWLAKDWLTDWPNDLVAEWLTAQLANDWLTECLTDLLTDWLADWLDDWLTDWGGLVFFSLTACRWSSEIVSRPILSQNRETRKPFSRTWWRTQNFLSYFVQNNRKSKFSIFDQNHGLTPLNKNPNMAIMYNQYYFRLGGLVSLTRWWSNIFSKPILFKNQKVRFSFFDKSHRLTTLKKFSIMTTWNPYFYRLGGRFF